MRTAAVFIERLPQQALVHVLERRGPPASRPPPTPTLYKAGGRAGPGHGPRPRSRTWRNLLLAPCPASPGPGVAGGVMVVEGAEQGPRRRRSPLPLPPLLLAHRAPPWLPPG